MRVQVTTNTKEVSRFMRRLFRDQEPFALAYGINEVTKLAQTGQRKHQRRVFDVKRPAFVDRAVKIRRGEFATKRNPRAIIRIDPPGGQARADILTKFEEDTTKYPTGSRLAIPTPNVKRTKAGVVSRTMRPRSLNFKGHGGKVFTGKSNVMRGDRRTVMFRKPGGRGGIFQRQGRGKGSQLVMLYYFRPSARINPELDFQQNVRRTVEMDWDRIYSLAFDRAIRGAR